MLCDKCADYLFVHHPNVLTDENIPYFYFNHGSFDDLSSSAANGCHVCSQMLRAFDNVVPQLEHSGQIIEIEVSSQNMEAKMKDPPVSIYSWLTESSGTTMCYRRSCVLVRLTLL